ncbi:MAG: CBS domain-containing protein, partial [Candidatus Aenigmatarchaeota archaeon]
MNLLEFSEQAIIFTPKDSVARVTSKMFEERVYNVIIKKNGKYYGIVSARDISRRNVNNPDEVEVKQFIKHINPISPETPISDVIDSVLVNNYNIVPITHDETYILTKLGILAMVKDAESLKKKKASDIMKYPFCASIDDSISTVISVMKEMDVARIPILNKNGKAEGLVTTIDLLKADIIRQRSKIGEKYGEKQKAKDTPITSIMQKDIFKITQSTPIKNVIELMINRKTDTILVEEKNKIMG